MGRKHDLTAACERTASFGHSEVGREGYCLGGGIVSCLSPAKPSTWAVLLIEPEADALTATVRAIVDVAAPGSADQDSYK